MDEFASPSLPKGRGTWLSYVADSRDVGHSKVTPDNRDTGLGQSPDCTPVGGLMRGPLTSTPSSDADVIHHLTAMVGQLGAQIGESIVEKLMSAGVVNMTSEHQTTTDQTTRTNVDQHDRPPQVTVHVNSDKGLQTFRGDSTDKYPVQDWIDMTKTHLRKRQIPVCDQAEEVMSHLMGKARDVVKISLRSDLALDVEPERIYNVLLHYFSVAPSCLPLADFYATLPKHRENPVDYWIRLNKAADLALEGLCRQGKRTENMNDEVALMFVKHCPDPELSCTLKFKPLHEWTARDVQSRIDDYQRELRARGGATDTVPLKNYITAVASEQPSQPLSDRAMSAQYLSASPSSPPLQIQHQQVCHPNPVQGEPCHERNLPQSEERLLTRMVDMFQEMMEKMQPRNTLRPTLGGRFQHVSHEKRSREAVCKVCNDSSHTTISHCMSDRLCFACHAPGHTKLNCTAKTSTQFQTEGN